MSRTDKDQIAVYSATVRIATVETPSWGVDKVLKKLRRVFLPEDGYKVRRELVKIDVIMVNDDGSTIGQKS